MTPERYQQIGQIYNAALELDPSQRTAFLDEVCAGDKALRQEIESLLEYHQRAETFIEVPALAVAAKVIAENQDRFQVWMKYCPKCQLKYAETQRFCTRDGVLLSLPDPYHLVGRTLADRYRIDALVGVGGMGAVYSAYHLGLDCRIAFKILLPHHTIANERMLTLFEREARIASRLHHENIVDIKDAGRIVDVDAIAYIVMEWLDGRTLEDEISIQGSLSFERIAYILRQIAAALEEAHARRIIHRDLKPSNVMLVKRPDGREQIKVLDFGIAKVISDTAGSSVSAVMGTPLYASPEQLHLGGDIDGRSDIYSLGVVLYQMLTATLPFNAPSIGELTRLQLTEPPPPLHKLRSDAPPALEELVNCMLAKDPDHRPQHVSGIPSLFDSALQVPPTEPIPSPVPPQEPTFHPPPKSKFGVPKPRLAIGGLVMVVGLAILGLVIAKGLKSRVYEFDVVTLDANGRVTEQRKEQAQYFTEDLDGRVALEMVKVPGGSFLMGTSEVELAQVKQVIERHRPGTEGEVEWEMPQRQVVVPPFYMGKFEVTQVQWRAVAILSKVSRELEPSAAHFKGDDLPVERVSWEDAVEFCARLSHKTGKTYRLPTEAEWEYACRAGTKTPFAFGEIITSQLVNYDGNFPYGKGPREEYRKMTTPVGSLRVANAFGLYDMHGNVFEWCQDVFHNSYQEAPTDGGAWENGNTDERVVRGGSWNYYGYTCRSAYRYRYPPSEKNHALGFRVVFSGAQDR